MNIFPPTNNLSASNRSQPSDEGLKMVSYCPVCHFKYDPVQAKVVAESDSAHLIHVRCQRCQSSVLALIMINPFGISSVGMVTELDSFEINKFKNFDIVNEDDVLGVYNALNANEFDFFDAIG